MLPNAISKSTKVQYSIYDTNYKACGSDNIRNNNSDILAKLMH